MVRPKFFRRFAQDQRASVLSYVAIFSMLGVGAGALAIDVGRMGLMRSEMQNRADAGAMAGAVQLDGQDDARERAEEIARSAISQISVVGRNAPTLTVQSVNFYSQWTPVQVAATSDLDAKIIRVVLTSQPIDFLFQPVLDLFSGGGQSWASMNATATAGAQPFVCNAPPMMMCDLSEEDPALDPTDPNNYGRQIRLKAPQGQNASWAPGNFGLLRLPDGTNGASAISQALASMTQEDCYQAMVITSTGSQTNMVKNGINVRFDISTYTDPPAPDVIAYPKDAELIADSAARMGSGNWDRSGYWAAKHGGAPLPSDLTSASRYQAYLYEQGLTYARNGLQTLYPAPATLPAGFSTVTPPGADIPVTTIPAQASNPDYDGVPQNTPASNGALRRVMPVAVLQCIADNVQGSHPYGTHGKYVDLFITEQVRDPPDASIYGEIVQRLTSNVSPDFHANVRLLQ